MEMRKEKRREDTEGERREEKNCGDERTPEE